VQVGRLFALVCISIQSLFGADFSVASYNVQNLFDEVYDGTEYESHTPGLHGWTPRMVGTKLEHTADVLCDLNADIVALQEIENDSILARLQSLMKRVGCEYRYRAITTQQKVPVHNALLSRYPITSQSDLSIRHTRRDRAILEVVVDIDGQPLRLFVNHWKSKSNGGKEGRRLEAAKVLRQRIDRLPKGADYLILGDLNSAYDEWLRLRSVHNNTGGRTGINHILQTIDDQGMWIFLSHLREGHFGVHYNLWLELPGPQRWSFRYRYYKGAIDHILLPAALMDGRGVEYVEDSFTVFKRGYLFGRDGELRSWDYGAGKHKRRGYSDHLPILARFTTKPRSSLQMQASIPSGTIEDLYAIQTLVRPMRLKGCVVVLRRGDHAVIKQHPKGRAILLYRVGVALKEGESYDLVIRGIQYYKGLKEIVDIAPEVRHRGSVEVSSYCLDCTAKELADEVYHNQIVTNLEGIYREGKLVMARQTLPLYFRHRGAKPPEGSRIRLLYARVGYHNGEEIVVYRKNDYVRIE
jgi:hypothetical protein